MTSGFTRDDLNTIRRNAGKVPTHEIAATIGQSVSFVERKAQQENIDLRMRPAPAPHASAHTMLKLPPSPPRLPADEKLGTQIGVRLRSAEEKIIRAKAAERFTLPGRLMRQVIEGAIMRNQIDELASAAKSYRPGDAAGSGEGE